VPNAAGSPPSQVPSQGAQPSYPDQDDGAQDAFHLGQIMEDHSSPSLKGSFHPVMSTLEEAGANQEPIATGLRPCMPSYAPRVPVKDHSATSVDGGQFHAVMFPLEEAGTEQGSVSADLRPCVSSYATRVPVQDHSATSVDSRQFHAVMFPPEEAGAEQGSVSADLRPYVSSYATRVPVQDHSMSRVAGPFHAAISVQQEVGAERTSMVAGVGPCISSYALRVPAKEEAWAEREPAAAGLRRCIPSCAPRAPTQEAAFEQESVAAGIRPSTLSYAPHLMAQEATFEQESAAGIRPGIASYAPHLMAQEAAFEQESAAGIRPGIASYAPHLMAQEEAGCGREILSAGLRSGRSNYAPRAVTQVPPFQSAREEFAGASQMIAPPRMHGPDSQRQLHHFGQASTSSNIPLKGGRCITNRPMASTRQTTVPVPCPWEDDGPPLLGPPCTQAFTSPSPTMRTVPGVPRRDSARMGGKNKACDADANITTLMIQNLSRHISQRDLIAELDNRGFAGLYDFCHLPMSFDTGRNKGFAFINFVSVEVAHSFQAAFHESYMWGTESLEKALRVVPAEVQGFEANAAKARSKKMQRVRNEHFKPMLAAAGDESAAWIASGQ